MSDSLTVTRPGALDVSRSNSRDILYIKGNETTDGSIRLIFIEGDDFARVQLRAEGVWNLTGFTFSPSTVELGPDMSLGAAAGFLETINPSAADDHVRALIPHVTFDETGTQELHSPILDVLKTTDIFTGLFGQITGKTLSQLFTVAVGQLVVSITHQVGDTGASESVVYSVFSGTDNTGFLLSEQELPASDFIANTPVVIEYNSDIGFMGPGNIFIEMVSENDFSLETNMDGDILTSLSSQELKTVDLVTQNMVLAEDLSLIFDNDLDITVEDLFK